MRSIHKLVEDVAAITLAELSKRRESNAVEKLLIDGAGEGVQYFAHTLLSELQRDIEAAQEAIQNAQSESEVKRPESEGQTEKTE